MASELARDGITAFIGKLSIAGLMLFVLTQAARRYGRYKRISVATSAVSDKMDNRKRLWLLRGAIILLALAALVGWWLIPGVRSFVQHSFSAFATLDQQALERFIHAYGPLAARSLSG